MKGAGFIARYGIDQARVQPARFMLAWLAIVASSSAVIWMVSGYDALLTRFDENAAKFLGRYDVLIVPAADSTQKVPAIRPGLIHELQQDAGVREVNPISQSRVTVTVADRTTSSETALDMLIGSRPPVYGAPPVDPVLVATPAVEEPYELVKGKWLDEKIDALQAVISRGAAERFGITIGDEIVVTSISNRVQLEIIGIVDQPPDLPNLEAVGSPDAHLDPRVAKAPRSSKAHIDPTANRIGVPTGVTSTPAVEAVYVRVPVAERINGFAATATFLQIGLRDLVSSEDFCGVWDTELASETPPLRVIDFTDVRSGLNSSESISGEVSKAHSATALASLAAAFIIFTTLSIGVNERAREYAILRAVALSRAQIGAIILTESCMLGLVGWLGGLFTGGVVVWLAGLVGPTGRAGSAVSWTTIALSGLSVLVGVFMAAIIPAWQAMRIRPFDGRESRLRAAAAHRPFVCLAIGVVLISIAPLCVFLLTIRDAWRAWLYAALGYPSLFVGVILMVPAAIILGERWVAPLLARMLFLNPALLRSQLSSNLLRTTGSTLAITAGLSLFTATHIWGYTMLRYYVPGDWLPDVLVAFHPVGLSDDEASLIDEVDGVARGEVLPLMVEQAMFAWQEDRAPPNVRRDNAIVIGLDAVRAFSDDRPFLNCQFVEGNPRELAEVLRDGNKCVVSEDFASLTGLKVGDCIPFTPPNNPDMVVEYEIAGIVSIPGWQWITKFSGMRRHSVRTFAIVFADIDRVRRDFQLNRNEFFWLNVKRGASIDKLEESFQCIAERTMGKTFIAESHGEVKSYRPFARVTATETVRKAILMVADEVIWTMSRLPMIALAIMSLAVASNMTASVRARRWQFGILRAVGTQRHQIVRMIVAEVLQIAFVACGLSLVFGVVAGLCGVGMSRYSGMFFSPLTIHFPWLSLFFGMAATCALCLASAIWPAMRAGYTEPLRLLQARNS